MGANISTNVSKFNQDIKNNVSQTCTSTSSCKNIMQGINVKFKGMNFACPVRFENVCIGDSTCNLTAQTTLTAEALNKYTNKQKASWLPGFNISTNVTDYTQNISNNITQSCNSNTDVENVLQNMNYEFDSSCFFAPVTLANMGNAKAQCSVSAITDILIKADNDTTNDQTGSSLIPGLNLGAALIGLGVLVLIGFIIYAIFGGLGKNDDKKSSGIQPTSLPDKLGKFKPRGNDNQSSLSTISQLLRNPQSQEAVEMVEANPELLLA